MFEKLKQLKDLRSKAKTLQNALGAETTRLCPVVTFLFEQVQHLHKLAEEPKLSGPPQSAGRANETASRSCRMRCTLPAGGG